MIVVARDRERTEKETGRDNIEKGKEITRDSERERGRENEKDIKQTRIWRGSVMRRRDAIRWRWRRGTESKRRRRRRGRESVVIERRRRTRRRRRRGRSTWP